MTYSYSPTPFMLQTSHYDEAKADRVVNFIQNLCHTKGKWAGERFLLLPWQEQIVRDLFGIVKKNGCRQFLSAYIEIPKKNGKSELAAAIALYLLYADHEPSAEVYGAACDRNQASIVFDVAKQMVQMCPALMDYNGNVTVKIDGLAASAASVIAMAGTKVCMSPVAMMMIHNPATIAIGDEAEMQKAIDMLAEVKESIVNAYEIKTGMSRVSIAHLMDAESWFNAKKAVELKFADEVLFTEEKSSQEPQSMEAMMFSRAAVTNSLLSRLIPKKEKAEKKIPVSQLEKRLSLLAH